MPHARRCKSWQARSSSAPRTSRILTVTFSDTVLAIGGSLSVSHHHALEGTQWLATFLSGCRHSIRSAAVGESCQGDSILSLERSSLAKERSGRRVAEGRRRGRQSQRPSRKGSPLGSVGTLLLWSSARACRSGWYSRP